MKRVFHFTSFVCTLVIAAMIAACNKSPSDGGGVSTLPQTPDVLAQPSGHSDAPASAEPSTLIPDEKYVISGFDIRTIGKYPEIERAIQVASGHYEGELTADDFLKVTKLDLNETGVKDLAPLAGLPNLTILLLFKNGINDISPLTGLVHLETLDLRINNITDISPLSKMTKLTGLFLSNNQIEDISPLAGMDKITDAYLGSNKIKDITPLSGWKSIERLSLGFNPLEDVTPLGQLKNLKQLSVVGCPVKDFSAVDHLVRVDP